MANSHLYNPITPIFLVFTISSITVNPLVTPNSRLWRWNSTNFTCTMYYKYLKKNVCDLGFEDSKIIVLIVNWAIFEVHFKLQNPRLGRVTYSPRCQKVNHGSKTAGSCAHTCVITFLLTGWSFAWLIVPNFIRQVRLPRDFPLLLFVWLILKKKISVALPRGIGHFFARWRKWFAPFRDVAF
jgi:hypothetical protein